MTYDELLELLAREGESDNADEISVSLWTLLRRAERVECCTRQHPLGIELLVVVNGTASMTATYRPSELDVMKAASAEIRRAFEADGWAETGA